MPTTPSESGGPAPAVPVAPEAPDVWVDAVGGGAVVAGAAAVTVTVLAAVSVASSSPHPTNPRTATAASVVKVLRTDGSMPRPRVYGDTAGPRRNRMNLCSSS